MTTRMLSNMNIHNNTLGKYKIVKTLGSGLHKVKLVYDPVSTKYYAAKVCKDKLKAPALEREASILRELNKVNVPNIIKCVEFIDSIDMSPKNSYQLDFNSIVVTPQENKYKGALILELASNGTMFDIIYYNQKLEEKLARTYFKKVVETVSALHTQGYVHRDLKCENILLDDQFQLKLADFGFAKEFSQLNGSLMKTRLGTESYMAPEMFTAKKYSGEKIDAFACGVVLFLFIFGRPPFFKASVRDPYYKNFDQDRPEKFWKIYEDKLNKGKEFDINLKGLISDLLKCDPDDRLDVKDICDYSWMKDEVYSDEELIEVMKPLKDIVKKGAKSN